MSLSVTETLEEYGAHRSYDFYLDQGYRDEPKTWVCKETITNGFLNNRWGAIQNAIDRGKKKCLKRQSKRLLLRLARSRAANNRRLQSL